LPNGKGTKHSKFRKTRALKLGHLRSIAVKGQSVSRGRLMSLLGAVGVMQEQILACLEKIDTAKRERDDSISGDKSDPKGAGTPN